MVADDLGTNIHSLTGHSALIDEVARLVASTFIYGIVVILGLVWVHRDGLRVVAAFALGLVIALGIGAVLGKIWAEPRPFVADHFVPLIAHGTDSSFPSDHLIVLGAIVGACLISARRLAMVGVALALLVAVARVYVGVHYPIDVVAGFMLGLVCAVTVWSVLGKAQSGLDMIDSTLSGWRVRPQRLR